MEWHLEGTSIPNPSEVAGILEALAPELYHQIKTETKFQKYICNDEKLKTIRVHPRFEMFTKGLMTPPFRRSCSAELYIDATHPEYEMHLGYTDRTEVIELNKDYKGC